MGSLRDRHLPEPWRLPVPPTFSYAEGPLHARVWPACVLGGGNSDARVAPDPLLLQGLLWVCNTVKKAWLYTE